MKSFKSVGLGFLVCGILISSGGAFWAKSTLDFVNRAIEFTGQISKVLTETCETTTGSGSNKRTSSYTCYRPFATYEFNGQVIEADMQERSPESYKIGSTVFLLVDPAEPKIAKFKGTSVWFGPLFLFCFGAIFATVGFSIVRTSVRSEEMKRYLKAKGNSVLGKVSFCGPNQQYRVNGRNPWIVEATWKHPQTNKPYTAKTLDFLWFDPQLSLQSDVEIKFDPKNPQRCMIELGNLSLAKAL